MEVLLLWGIRIVILLLVVRYVASLFSRSTPAPRRRGRPRVPERAGGTLVRDPQCGTFVPESGSLSLQRDGATLHFCSSACRDGWLLAHPK